VNLTADARYVSITTRNDVGVLVGHCELRDE